jgi:LCP family protein required for cell wall assembly
MRLLRWLTLFFVLSLVPMTGILAYFSYIQARQRVAELNEITPLNETDLEKVVRLSVGLDVAQPDAETPSAPPASSLGASPTPARVPENGASLPLLVDATPVVGEPTPEATSVAVNTAPTLDPRRVTVLLMGIDQREGEEGQFRTDTMIVLTLDPIAKTGAMLSIPRDLWVSIPGTGTQGRINTANFVGDNPSLNYPGGGPALAMLTVENLLGIPIDHYLLVNFTAFTTFVNTLGEIEICVRERIDDPKYPDGSYGYNPIVIEAGCQPMGAERLLQYARTRATSGGDFDRAKRQQEVILAVRNKILSAGGASALLGNALTLWQSVSANVRTDLTLDELIELALAAQEINDIRSATIGEGEVLPGVGTDGSDILIPIQTDIFALVADLTRPPSRPAAPPGSVVVPDPNNVPLIVREEAALIAILNGTTIQGRAGALRDVLLSYNIDVAMVGNAATTDVVETSIVYYGNHAQSAAYVAAILATLNGNNLPPIQRGEGSNPKGDLIIVVGTDLAIPQSQ